MSSLFTSPLSLAACKSAADGASGATRSIVVGSVSLATLPNVSVKVTAIGYVPCASAAPGVYWYVPPAPTTSVTSTVPSFSQSISIVPASFTVTS